jgi:hypothetical protein
VRLGWTTNWFSSYYQVGAPGNPTGVYDYYTTAQGSNSIPHQTYHQLFGSYVSDVSGPLSHLTVQGGIKNVFNTVPPFDVWAAPFYRSYYGNISLRTYWLSLKWSF